MEMERGAGGEEMVLPMEMVLLRMAGHIPWRVENDLIFIGRYGLKNGIFVRQPA